MSPTERLAELIQLGVLERKLKRKALGDHEYCGTTQFCVTCGCHSEHIAHELIFCLTKEQRFNVIAISHIRALRIQKETEERVAKVDAALVSFAAAGALVPLPPDCGND